MKLHPASLLSAERSFYYLFGEDRDAIFDAAETLVGGASDDLRVLRIDIDEIDRIPNEVRHEGLFGQSRCHVLVRNAESVGSKQAEKLLRLADQDLGEARIVVCAAGVDTRKSWHKRIVRHPQVCHCQFRLPSADSFRSWLMTQLAQSGLKLTKGSTELLLEHLQGKREAARNVIESLRIYDHGEGGILDVEVVGALLGERASEDIGTYCHEVACRSRRALSRLHRLLRDQLVPEIQILSWLQTRFVQLLMYKWYASRDASTAVTKAKIYAANRARVQQEAGQWTGRELILALGLISDSERLLKGASTESGQVVLEHLTRDLLLLGRSGAD
jgi:DNA polymerase III delta subunit